MRVVRRITAITKQEYFFLICQVANRARDWNLILLGVLVDPCLRIKFGNLLLVLDGSCR